MTILAQLIVFSTIIAALPLAFALALVVLLISAPLVIAFEWLIDWY